MSDSTQYILPVRRVSKDGGDYCVKCPHCGAIIGIDGDDLSVIRGEQYHHKKREWQSPHGKRFKGCDGWFEVTDDARFVRELEPEPKAQSAASE